MMIYKMYLQLALEDNLLHHVSLHQCKSYFPMVSFPSREKISEVLKHFLELTIPNVGANYILKQFNCSMPPAYVMTNLYEFEVITHIMTNLISLM